MLTISIDNEAQIATQRDSSPTVYLDHWALRELSTMPTLVERFVAALKQRNGTLALSSTNLIEFCNMTDDEQARCAEELLPCPRIQTVQRADEQTNPSALAAPCRARMRFAATMGRARPGDTAPQQVVVHALGDGTVR